ncbi:MAG: DUF6273 domain-containing protein [Eubacteriales bacterium]|nr:DUF6273 domain-containing protein [Eubacteriales bacterium]
MRNTKPLSLILCLCLLAVSLPAAAQTQLQGYSGGYQYAAFGSYPQTGAGEKQPILWRVLWAGPERAYLLSDKILDVKRVDGDQWQYKGWETSELNAWLNTAFIEEAFTLEEQAALAGEEGLGRVSLPSSDDIKNRDYGFINDKSRYFYGTDYAFSQGLYSYTRGKHSPIFTRTISSRAHAHRATKVDGSIGFIGVESDDLGLLPVIWLDLTKVQALSGSGTQFDPLLLAPRTGQ